MSCVYNKGEATSLLQTWAGFCTLWRWTSCWLFANSAISHILPSECRHNHTTRSHQSPRLRCRGTRHGPDSGRSQPHSTVPDSEPTRSRPGAYVNLVIYVSTRSICIRTVHWIWSFSTGRPPTTINKHICCNRSLP